MRANFETAEKRLQPYLRALWNRDIRLHPFDQVLQQRPYLSERGIHLPPLWHGEPCARAFLLYRAAATHAAAHLAYSQHRFLRRNLKPVQIVLISLLEDARVEDIAINLFPGLRRLWLQCFPPPQGQDDSFTSLALRLARALLDPAYADGNPWIAKAKRLYAASQSNGSDPVALREVGSLLGNDIGQMRLQFNAKTYLVEPRYRDDNTALWDSAEPPAEADVERQDPATTFTTSGAPPQYSRGERGREVAAREVATGEAEQPATAVAHYPEWDSRSGAMRPHWCRLFEPAMAQGDPAALYAAMARHAALARRLARVIRARQAPQPARLRRQPEGDRFDLEGLVRSAIALRAGIAPDARIYTRTLHGKLPMSALLLLDLSASTNSVMADMTMLDAIREAAVLLAVAMRQSGNRYAIDGFRSNGRHEINYLRFMDFGGDMDEAVLGRLAAVEGAQSTRLGAALRHATARLAHERSERRLILVITDGEPHDIDVFQAGYLTQDAARAVREAAWSGAEVFCVAVDRNADGYVRHIFGEHNYLVMDNVTDLPTRLQTLYR